MCDCWWKSSWTSWQVGWGVWEPSTGATTSLGQQTLVTQKDQQVVLLERPGGPRQLAGTPWKQSHLLAKLYVWSSYRQDTFVNVCLCLRGQEDPGANWLTVVIYSVWECVYVCVRTHVCTWVLATGEGLRASVVGMPKCQQLGRQRGPGGELLDTATGGWGSFLTGERAWRVLKSAVEAGRERTLPSSINKMFFPYLMAMSQRL